MRVAFTGSRNGMTDAQIAAFIDLAIEGGWTEFHHGDCRGADERALWLLIELGGGGVLHCHPPTQNVLRAHTDRHEMLGQIVHPPLPYLARNRAIVDACDMLIAAPDQPEHLRSGTWSTVRYARSLEKIVRVLNPEGGIS